MPFPPLLFLLLFLSLAGNVYFLYKNIDRVRVVSVHDGDTLTIASGERVKLLGVDAPELGKCGGDMAKKKLEELTLHKHIRITEEKRDTYGRRMGLVYLGNSLINEIILKEGLARPDYTKNSKNDVLKKAYAYAKENSLGIHSALCEHLSPTPPTPDCVIKGNIDKATWEHLYHLPNCRHYNQIVLDEDVGEGFFCSEKEAQDAGFTLAPDCLR